MLVKLYKFPGLDYPKDDSIKINFEDRSDIWNPFADINYKKSFNVETADEISIIYLKTILITAIKFETKELIYNTRKSFPNLTEFLHNPTAIPQNLKFIDKNMDRASKIIEDTVIHNIWSDVLTLVTPNNNEYSNVFIETEDLHDKYLFSHQFQWNFKYTKPFGIINNFRCLLASKIQQV